MKRKLPILLTSEELEGKETRALLGYLKRLQKCELSFEHSDMDVNPDLDDEMTIYFKQTHKWKTAYNRVKSILDSREHIA